METKSKDSLTHKFNRGIKAKYSEKDIKFQIVNSSTIRVIFFQGHNSRGLYLYYYICSEALAFKARHFNCPHFFLSLLFYSKFLYHRSSNYLLNPNNIRPTVNSKHIRAWRERTYSLSSQLAPSVPSIFLRNCEIFWYILLKRKELREMEGVYIFNKCA